MSNQVLDEATEPMKIEMTPMIDVTFLLLIFFLCSIKFKVLEGKLQTYLPKDVGVNTTPQTEVLEKIDIRIVRKETRAEKNLDNIDTFSAWKWNMNQVDIRLNGQKMESLEQLSKALKKLREAVPMPAEGEDDDLKMNLEAMKGVIYEDVVHVVDIALDAKFTSITFRGIELDA